MKKSIFFKSLIVLFTIVSFISCETEPLDPAIDLTALNPNNPNNPNNPVGSFTAKIDGQLWTAQSTAALIGGNLMAINATIGGDTGESFSFLIDGVATGTYPANENILTYSPAGTDFGWSSLNFNNPTENTGSITITSINTVNKTISGTFSFKGYWSDDTPNIAPKNITEGVFTNITYEDYLDTNNDTFFAKINGTEFVETDILAVTVNGVIGIGAANTNDQSITIGVDENITPGTYTITGDIATDMVQATYKLNNTTSLMSNSGTVTITSITLDRVIGTFSFNVVNGSTPYVITEGAFDVEY
ncbi:DUF6252 family protein [uncultured Flavobacterium sp.]|uniref:DUF6252 family protein n=1 Tax=uncultured Flavobacterium sp. TaxID=165435 RepID=UPI0030EF0723